MNKIQSPLLSPSISFRQPLASLLENILIEVRRLKAIKEKVFLLFKPISISILVFILPARQMFLRFDVNVMQFQENSKQHKIFWQTVEYQKHMYYSLCFFKSWPVGKSGTMSLSLCLDFVMDISPNPKLKIVWCKQTFTNVRSQCSSR